VTTTVAPGSLNEAQQILLGAIADDASVGFVGSGSARPIGTRPTDVLISSERLVGVVDYEPDDMTVVVRSGMTVAELGQLLSDRSLSAFFPETAPERTIGGVIATGTSGYSRLRYGPTRDRILGMAVVTGYGKVIHGGGRLVKNVTGYDLPRLVTGSFGAMGFIGEVCLKLIPDVGEKRTVVVESAAESLADVYRPVAVLETESGSSVYIEGAAGSIDAVAGSLGGSFDDGHAWPDPFDDPFVVSVRVAPRNLAAAVDAVRNAGATRFVAQHGVGIVDAGFDSMAMEALVSLRSEVPGVVVVTHWPERGAQPDRWGFAPSATAIQQRMIDLFDPAGVLNAGQLPGGG
jgi:glycolate oxidase FAD binding subunit